MILSRSGIHADDVDRAVEAAARAFPSWSATSVSERLQWLTRLLDEVVSRKGVFARQITAEVGTPTRTASLIQVGLGIADLKSAIAVLEGFEWSERIGNSLVVREPIGVVGAITPWNYPLHQITAKIGVALAAGCTVVLKPSEVAPGCALELIDILDTLGLPPGVLNMVCGTGPVVGESLVSHPLVDMVTFTGSNVIGKRVSERAAATVKRVALELGGKSASIITPGADIEKAVAGTLRGCFVNGGQSCSAFTRMLVPRDMLEEIETLVLQAVAAFVPGDPTSPDTRLGPLASALQRDRVLEFITSGIDEGATLLTGGVDRPEGVPTTGFFVAPTVFSNVDRTMTIATEEIFGPVLSIMPYDGEDDAVDIANSTRFGLSGAVWAADDQHAESIARRMRTAQVEINGGQFNPIALRRLQAVRTRT